MKISWTQVSKDESSAKLWHGFVRLRTTKARSGVPGFVAFVNCELVGGPDRRYLSQEIAQRAAEAALDLILDEIYIDYKGAK